MEYNVVHTYVLYVYIILCMYVYILCMYVCMFIECVSVCECVCEWVKRCVIRDVLSHTVIMSFNTPHSFTH